MSILLRKTIMINRDELERHSLIIRLKAKLSQQLGQKFIVFPHYVLEMTGKHICWKYINTA